MFLIIADCENLFNSVITNLQRLGDSYVHYHQTSNISFTLVGIKIVAHSDVVGALPVGTQM